MRYFSGEGCKLSIKTFQKLAQNTNKRIDEQSCGKCWKEGVLQNDIKLNRVFWSKYGKMQRNCFESNATQWEIQNQYRWNSFSLCERIRVDIFRFKWNYAFGKWLPLFRVFSSHFGESKGFLGDWEIFWVTERLSGWLRDILDDRKKF